MKTCATVLVVLAGALAGTAAAENWPQWRGPALNGSTTETGLPAKFSATENVIWSADLPGIGGATPIVWGENVFVSAMEPDSKKLWAVCLGAADGKVRWKLPMGEGFTNKMGNTGASPSPITDGKTVWFYYGSGRLAATDLSGKVLWQRNIQEDHGEFEILWAYASSPLLYEGRLYIPVLHADHRKADRDISYLLCVDPATGKDIWKCPRITDAKGESRQAFITPFPLAGKGGWQVLIHGGDYLTGHDPADGKMLWKSSDYNPSKNMWWRTVPSAVGADGVAVGYAPKGGRMFAVRTEPGDGKPAGSDLWQTRYNSPDVCTPLIYRGRLFVLDGRKKELVCMDLKTGQVHWKGDLPAKAVFQASATGADGKVYCINLDGEAVVASAGDSFEVLHHVAMGGKNCRSTIAAANGRLFLRTDTKLYCIGKAR